MLPPVTFEYSDDKGKTWSSVQIDHRDYAKYEDVYEKNHAVAFTKGLWVFFEYCVWHALTRDKATEDTWDEFAAKGVLIRQASEPKEPRPLDQEAPSGS